jgi:peptide/nickel transport system permease protein
MERILTMILGRLLLAGVILSLVALAVFVGTEILPGDAITATIPQDELIFYSDADLAQLRAAAGLDRPAWIRFADMWWGLFSFDFGVTLTRQEPVLDRIYHPLINSLIMAGLTTVVVLVISIGLGIAAALRPGGWLDTGLSGATLFAYSMPDFVVGNVFVIVFAVWLGIVPAVILFNTDAPALSVLGASVLPVLALCISGVAYQFRLLRSGMIDALSSEFIERARLSGVSKLRIALVHALPIAVIPMLSGTAYFVAGLISGTVVIEAVFKFPGVGLELLRSLAQREIPTVQAIAFMAAFAVVFTNLLADLAVLLLDPRVRRGRVSDV